jgi:hypothetical protein
MGSSDRIDGIGSVRNVRRAWSGVGWSRSKAHGRLLSTILLLSGVGLFVPSLSFSDSCSDPKDHPNKIAGLPQSDGTTTVTYSAVGGGAVTSEAAAAFSSWNSLSSQTGVTFVAASGSSVGQVQVGYDSSIDCIATSPAYGTIKYGSNFLPDITTPYTTDGTLSFGHEIGHLLGLRDNVGNNSDIMDQSTNCTPADKGYSWDATSPTSSDGTQVGTCQDEDRDCGDDT